MARAKTNQDASYIKEVEQYIANYSPPLNGFYNYLNIIDSRDRLIAFLAVLSTHAPDSTESAAEYAKEYEKKLPGDVPAHDLITKFREYLREISRSNTTLSSPSELLNKCLGAGNNTIAAPAALQPGENTVKASIRYIVDGVVKVATGFFASAEQEGGQGRG
jgi:hypothetical protein